MRQKIDWRGALVPAQFSKLTRNWSRQEGVDIIARQKVELRNAFLWFATVIFCFGTNQISVLLSNAFLKVAFFNENRQHYFPAAVCQAPQHTRSQLTTNSRWNAAHEHMNIRVIKIVYLLY